MPSKVSAGILLYRLRAGQLEVFLVHPGGPYWARKDEGAWSIPKGELEPGDDALTRARQEFREETGADVGAGVGRDFFPLTPVRQAGGKFVHAWAVAGDFDPAGLRSNTFTMEWPPRSGRQAAFPEVDRGAWLGLAEAQQKLIPAQRAWLDELSRVLDEP
jgi:predicted NUDIX family NTP pyrophosphohydrolase